MGPPGRHQGAVPRLTEPRPLWTGFGAPNVLEPLTELIRLGLINGGYE